MTEGPGGSIVALGYWFSVAGRQYFEALLKRMEHSEIERWFYVLVVIDHGKGKLSQQELADALRMDKVTVTRAIDHLSELGYVERCDCAGDRRKHLLKVTPKARPALRDLRKIYTSLNEQALAGIDPKEQERFLRYLHLVVTNLHTDTPVVGANQAKIPT
jgi:MarR family transcriptional regulator for hemolysin